MDRPFCEVVLNGNVHFSHVYAHTSYARCGRIFQLKITLVILDMTKMKSYLNASKVS
jgi:hypothetical protein